MSKSGQAFIAATEGTQFILGDYFIITPETNFSGNAEKYNR